MWRKPHLIFADHLVKPDGLTNVSEVTETEIKILDAAKKVFERHGFAGARMQQIADEAAISKASLHYHFRSKEKLFDHIFETTMAELMTLVSTWEDDSDDWESKLRSFIKNFFAFIKTKSILFILSELNRNPDLMAERRKGAKGKKNRFLAYFEKIQASGQIAPGLDMRYIYIFLHSLCAYPILNSAIFKMTCQMNDREFDRLLEAYPAFVADFLIQGIKNKSIQ